MFEPLSLNKNYPPHPSSKMMELLFFQLEHPLITLMIVCLKTLGVVRKKDLFILVTILLFQKSDKSGGSFHAEMISEEEDGTTVWENGLYNPSKAKNVQYSV